GKRSGPHPTRSSEPFGEEAEVDPLGPAPLNLAVRRAGCMALRTHRRQARDCDRLAPERLSPFLDLEGPAWPTRASVDSERRTRADPSDEPREPDLGRPQDSRRAAQTRYEHRRDQREQVPGSSPE